MLGCMCCGGDPSTAEHIDANARRSAVENPPSTLQNIDAAVSQNISTQCHCVIGNAKRTHSARHCAPLLRGHCASPCGESSPAMRRATVSAARTPAKGYGQRHHCDRAKALSAAHSATPAALLLHRCEFHSAAFHSPF